MRDECLNCDCTNESGCRFDKPKTTRKYVMKKPRGRRGPYRRLKDRAAELTEAVQ